MKFFFSTFGLIDLLAILPFYIVALGVDFRFVRIFRLFRIFRILKAARYVKALQIINDVIKAKKEQLTVTMIFCLFLVLIVSSMMYYIENAVQPEAFSSIPQTMWWGVTNLSTVGYGDVYPLTPIGKILGGLISLLAIGIFALPSGILASGFSEEMKKRSE